MIKDLLQHLLVSLVVIGAWWFVLYDQAIGVEERAKLVVFLLLFNAAALLLKPVSKP